MLNSKIKIISIKKMGKWAKFADRMSGLTSPQITKHIENTTKDMRNNFKFRNLPQND